MLTQTNHGMETMDVCEEPGSPAGQSTKKRLRSGVKAGWDEGMSCGSTGGPSPLGLPE